MSDGSTVAGVTDIPVKKAIEVVVRNASDLIG